MGPPFSLNLQNRVVETGACPVLGSCKEDAAGRVRDPSPHNLLLWPMCVHSLYTKPATTAAKIEPIHRSSIHPSGNMVGIGDQAACPKLPGTPAQNPTIIPILRAVFGPGPAVARAHAYKCAMRIDITNISTIQMCAKSG